MVKLWQPITEFTDALQNPKVCFHDPNDPDDPVLAELAAGQPELNPNDRRPLRYPGNFACVYPIVCGEDKYALRCFIRQVDEPEKLIERYRRLSNFFKLINSEAFVEYSYYERGILVKGEWFPTIRMDWVEGIKLHRYVEENLSRSDRIRQLCDQLLEVTRNMQVLSIAHNDLQHGNVMVQADGQIRLVDYDGFYLPHFQGQPSPELGEDNYKHPFRTKQDYGIFVDNFPALVIYLSLLALSVDSRLWRHNEGDHLILTKADLADPANSECFRDLKASRDPSVQHLAEYLERCCSTPVDQIPNLEEILNGAPAPSAPPPTVSAPATAPGASPLAPSSNASPATGPKPKVIGGGSEYLQLINLMQAGQAPSNLVPPVVPPPTPPQPASPPATPTPPPAAPATIVCPRCSRSNPDDYHYCDDDGCIAPLHPGTRFCDQCGKALLVNANFCITCGSRLV